MRPAVAKGTHASTRKRTELAAQRAEIQLRRYELYKWLVPVVWIASLWIPLQAILPIARALAGRQTNVSVTLTLSIVVSLAFGAGMLAMFIRSRAQRRELRRLRSRITELEKELPMKQLKAGQ